MSRLPLMIVFLGLILLAFKIVRQEEMITVLESRMSMTESYQTNICNAVIFIKKYYYYFYITCKSSLTLNIYHS